jgi:hypothetical protein
MNGNFLATKVGWNPNKLVPIIVNKKACIANSELKQRRRSLDG